jgi:long-chain acyl-CoA synthetase
MPHSGNLSWPLAHAARRHAGRTAVIDGDRRLTYAELAARVARLGSGLAGLGVAEGDSVGMLALNSLEHLEGWLAIPTHGRVINDLNIRLAPAELRYMLDESHTTVLITDAAHVDVARELRETSTSLQTLVYAGPGECPADCRAYETLLGGPPAEPPEIASDWLAAISYTGETTGPPKGVMLSHGNLIANAKHILIGLSPTKEDRWLHASPMFHVADSSQTFAMSWIGATHVMLGRFDPASAVDAIQAHGVTMTIVVPTMLRALLDEIAEHPSDLRSLRTVMYGASPIAPDVQERAVRELPGELVQGYGATETAPALCLLGGEDHRRGVAGEEPFRSRLTSAGCPIPGVQVEIRDPAGREVALGEVGEITARGPNIMLGYFNKPDATAQALVDGWYRTGDAGWMDVDGYVTIVDRLKDMIITGGENVYSAEVERALVGHREVVEAAVFGVPDERWGERVTAVVVTRATIDPDELVAHCRHLIAGYKIPRTIAIQADPLPKSGAGKTLKREVKRRYQQD